MDGSSYSSPIESPTDAPITSSIVTLQSAESLSPRQRQVRPLSVHCNENTPHKPYEPYVPYDGVPTTQRPNVVPNQMSLTKTPDTPSANISPHSSSGLSQAFTSHFTSESSLLPNKRENPTPSAVLTPSTQVSDETDGQTFDDYFNFGDEVWDSSNFDYDLSIMNIDGLSIKSCQSF